MKGLPTAPFPAISISCHLSKPDLSQAGQSPEEIGVCLLRETSRRRTRNERERERDRCTFAGFPVRDGLGQVSVVALFAVVAVAPGCVVATVETNAAALPARQLVQLHVEAASPGVKVAVTGCGERREMAIN